MRKTLVISERIPREMAAIAKDYYSYHGESHVKVARVWYAVYKSCGKSVVPSWVLVRYTDRSGRECSTICNVDWDINGDWCMDEFLGAAREKEELLLSDWQRMVDRMDEEG